MSVGIGAAWDSPGIASGADAPIDACDPAFDAGVTTALCGSAPDGVGVCSVSFRPVELKPKPAIASTTAAAPADASRMVRFIDDAGGTVRARVVLRVCDGSPTASAVDEATATEREDIGTRPCV